MYDMLKEKEHMCEKIVRKYLAKKCYGLLNGLK
jgi:hypothetical protein